MKQELPEQNAEPDTMSDHNYDGIQEYDNPLPFWWVAIFWASIVFSCFYFVFYHLGPGLLTIDAYNKDMVAYYDLQAQQFLALGEIKESTLYDLTSNESMMAGAQQVFQTRCAQCHGDKGQGNIGPNLTDDYWLHGGQLTDIYHTVMEGVPEKGMQSWKMQLGPAELLSVAAYVGTLRETSPAGGKPPQGDLQEYVPPAPEDENQPEGGGDAPADGSDATAEAMPAARVR